MNKPDQDPGYATLAELAAYWRMPSKRAARELARALGLRRVRGKFPWFAIWQAEWLAPPPKKRWDELKHPHLTTTDLAELLGESERSARRRDHAKRLVRRPPGPDLSGEVQIGTGDCDGDAKGLVADQIQRFRSLRPETVCGQAKRQNDGLHGERKNGRTPVNNLPAILQPCPSLSVSPRRLSAKLIIKRPNKELTNVL